MKDKNINVNGVSTFNWDTTYTTSYKVINESIRKFSTSPTEFDSRKKPELLTNLTDSPEVNLYVSGKWDQWSLYCLQGNGNSVFLKLPVKSGTIEMEIDINNKPEKIKGDLSDGYLIIETQLNIIRTSDTKSIVLGEKSEMKVSVSEHNFPHIEKNSTLDICVDGIFNNYLNTEDVISQFKHVFATVSINDKATGDFAWLEPSDLSYAVFTPGDTGTEDNSIFSMLCMTDNKTAPESIQKSIDAEVFNGKNKEANAVLCISPQRFCEHILIETSKNLIQGSKNSDFEYSTDGMEIHNINDIVIKNVEVNDGKIKDLKISSGNYTIRVMNDYLEIFITDASYHEDLYNVYINFNQKLRFTTEQKNNIYYFLPVEGDYYNANIHVEVEPTKTGEIIQWVGVAFDIASALTLLTGAGLKAIAKITSTSTRAAVAAETSSIAATTATVVDAAANLAKGTTKGLSISNALMAGSTICGVLGLGLSLPTVIATAIAKKDFSNIPTLNEFSKKLLSNIKWTGVQDTELKGARLNNAFLMDFKVNV